MSIEEGLRVFARDILADRFRVGSIPEATAVAMIDLLDPWQAGEGVVTGEIRSLAGTVYVCVQAHVTQADWTPEATPALWRAYRTTGTEGGSQPDPWVQPTGAHDAYALGDQVTHDGQIWTSLVAANVWEPGAVGSEALWAVEN